MQTRLERTPRGRMAESEEGGSALGGVVTVVMLPLEKPIQTKGS